MLQTDIDVGRTNTFVFDEDQRRFLENRLRTTQRASFRLDGPRAGVSNVFSWDTGYSGGISEPPVLTIVFRAPGAGDDPLPTPDPADTERINEIVRLINLEREKAGVMPVTVASELMVAARDHNLDMAFNDFFSHTGSDGSLPPERIARAGFRAAAVGEILAAATSNPGLVVETWMGRDQRDVVLDPRLTHIGVHYVVRDRTAYRHYWTVKMAQAVP
jgi:uncharacterized protein YkwD